MYQCCIFDLDGTLVNSIHALKHTVNLTLETWGLGPVDENHIKQFVGDGYQKLIERSLLFCGDETLVHYKEASELYCKLFKIHSLFKVEAYDGIREMLAFLKERNIKIAVLSNKPHERTIENVEAVFGAGYFDLISGEKDGVKRKPDPEGAWITAKALGILPEGCLYLGDTNTDMRTGAAAGMDTAGVTWGFRDQEELESCCPKYLIHHPEEIIEVFKNTNR